MSKRIAIWRILKFALLFMMSALMFVAFLSVLKSTHAKAETNEPVNIHCHKYTNIIAPPTCMKSGLSLFSCDCGDSYTNTIEALSHQYTQVEYPQTCENDGYIQHTCQTCGDQYRTDIIKASGHMYETIIIQPTCVEKGHTTYKCATCLHEHIDNEVDPLGHKYKTQKIEPTYNSNGYDYHKCTACGHSYKDNETAPLPKEEWPKCYQDETCKITIYKEWYEDAYVYAAHIEFSDYTRLGTDCANGQYNKGYETTSHAAKRLNAIFAVNGCYSAPYLNYTVVRGGIIWNGADRKLTIPGVYSNKTGIFQGAYDGSNGTPGISGVNVQQLVDDGLITDTFCFGPPGLVNGNNMCGNDNSRAQRTFMGSNGNAGDLWVCVSDGRKNDGKSAGLTYKQCMDYLLSKGCAFGINLDGGGSSTMYFNGTVLNAAKGNERAVVDFLYFR